MAYSKIEVVAEKEECRADTETLSPWAIVSRVYNYRGNTIPWVRAVPTVSQFIRNYILSFFSSRKFPTISKFDFTWRKTKAKQNKNSNSKTLNTFLSESTLWMIAGPRVSTYALSSILSLWFQIDDFPCLLVKSPLTKGLLRLTASFHTQGQNTLPSHWEGQPRRFGW